MRLPAARLLRAARTIVLAGPWPTIAAALRRTTLVGPGAVTLAGARPTVAAAAIAFVVTLLAPAGLAVAGLVIALRSLRATLGTRAVLLLAVVRPAVPAVVGLLGVAIPGGALRLHRPR